MEEKAVYHSLFVDHGANDVETGEYSLADYAIKSREYTCPQCNQKLILKKGNIKRHHFAHYSQELDCGFYNVNRASEFNRIHEGLLHKTAKIMLKQILEEAIGKSIYVFRNCATQQCDNYEPIHLWNINENTSFELEYMLKHENRNIRPDLTWLDKNEVKYIFEVYDTSKTKEYNRPEGMEWFEFKAEDIIQRFKEGKFNGDEIQFSCMRDIIKCDHCVKVERIILRNKLEKEQKRQLQQEAEKKRLEQEAIVYRTTCQKCRRKKADNIYKYCFQCNMADKNNDCKCCGELTKYELCWKCYRNSTVN
jgi:hypothetical protein